MKFHADIEAALQKLRERRNMTNRQQPLILYGREFFEQFYNYL